MGHSLMLCQLMTYTSLPHISYGYFLVLLYTVDILLLYPLIQLYLQQPYTLLKYRGHDCVEAKWEVFMESYTQCCHCGVLLRGNHLIHNGFSALQRRARADHRLSVLVSPAQSIYPAIFLKRMLCSEYGYSTTSTASSDSGVLQLCLGLW